MSVCESVRVLRTRPPNVSFHVCVCVCMYGPYPVVIYYDWARFKRVYHGPRLNCFPYNLMESSAQGKRNVAAAVADAGANLN